MLMSQNDLYSEQPNLIDLPTAASVHGRSRDHARRRG